jgi:signal transduction histidine kinase
VEELRTTWPGRSIELEVRGDARGELDPVRMGQVLSNLLANALTDGDAHRPVEVVIDGRRSSDELSLLVKNYGPAIPPELMFVMFEPFRRGGDDTSPTGLGLGLYIVQQIALAHGGTVSVESMAETGTVFEVRLPRRPEAKREVAAGCQPHALPDQPPPQSSSRHRAVRLSGHSSTSWRSRRPPISRA